MSLCLPILATCIIFAQMQGKKIYSAEIFYLFVV